MRPSAELARFLGTRGHQAIERIDDPALQEHVTLALQICADTLAIVDAFDLSEYELSTTTGDELSLWRSVGPRVQHLLWAAGDAGERLRGLFPGPSPALASAQAASAEGELNLDEAFSLMEAGQTPLEPIRDHRALEIDIIVQRVNVNRQEILGESISALAGMLQEDFARFGTRLKNPHLLKDKWALLGELQELHNKCSECLEATVATILQAFVHEDITDILPRYTDAALRAAKLRAVVVDLAYDVKRVQDAIAELDREKSRVFHEYLVQRMDHFVGLPEYRHLRASDKKEFILFRIFLFNWGESDKSVQALREQVEGFSKFLELMRAINQRHELLSHDRRYLAAAETVLQSNLDTNRARPYLDMVFGRSDPLDQMIRLCRQGYPIDRKNLEHLVRDVHEKVKRAATPF